MELADKWTELGEKIHSEEGNPDSKGQTLYVLTYKYILTQDG